MRAFGVVELQRAGEGVEDLVGHTGDVAFLQPRVVVGGHPGEQGHFLAAESGHAAAAAVHGHAGLLRAESGAPGGEEFPDLGAVVVHDVHATTGRRGVGGSAGTPITATWPRLPGGGCIAAVGLSDRGLG